MDDILQVNERLRGLIWGAPMLILLLGTGLYFTAVTGVFQVRYCMLWLRKTLFPALPVLQDGQAAAFLRLRPCALRLPRRSARATSPVWQPR